MNVEKKPTKWREKKRKKCEQMNPIKDEISILWSSTMFREMPWGSDRIGSDRV